MIKDFDPPYYVYIFMCEQYIKIGISKNAKKRFANFGTDNPFNVYFLTEFYTPNREVAYDIEQYTHTILKDIGAHKKGEWFKFEYLAHSIFLISLKIKELCPSHYGLKKDIKKRLQKRNELTAMKDRKTLKKLAYKEQNIKGFL